MASSPSLPPRRPSNTENGAPGGRTRWLRAALVLFLAVGLTGLTACDSGSEEPVPRFSAELQTGPNTSTTVTGTAGLTNSEQFEGDLSASLQILPALLPDSATVPDSLLTPTTIDLQASTFVFLTSETGQARGRSITLLFPGEEVPGTGAYSLDGSSPAADIPFVAAYTDYRNDDLLLAPASAGTVTINRSASDVLEGEFTLSLASAVEIQGIGTAGIAGGAPFETVETRSDYEGASLTGSFTAVRDPEARPLLPFIGSGGLPLPSTSSSHDGGRDT